MPSSRRRRAAASFPATPSGVHLLSCPGVIDRLVRTAGVGDGDLAVDLGAGPGAITGRLAGTGARVLAVERDARFVATLRRRFADRPTVRIVHGDVRAVPLPRRGFAVVASIPFAVSTPLLRRLLTPVGGGLDRAELVVEWGLARRLTAATPRDLESAWWAARFAMTVRGRVPARCFSPAPRVDAAHLAIRPRAVDGRTAAILWTLLSTAYRRRDAPARNVVGTRSARRTLGDRPAGEVTVAEWVAVAGTLARDRSVAPPALPKSLRP